MRPGSEKTLLNPLAPPLGLGELGGIRIRLRIERRPGLAMLALAMRAERAPALQKIDQEDARAVPAIPQLPLGAFREARDKKHQLLEGDARVGHDRLKELEAVAELLPALDPREALPGVRHRLLGHHPDPLADAGDRRELLAQLRRGQKVREPGRRGSPVPTHLVGRVRAASAPGETSNPPRRQERPSGDRVRARLVAEHPKRKLNASEIAAQGILIRAHDFTRPAALPCCAHPA
jgi:hypothetical protein